MWLWLPVNTFDRTPFKFRESKKHVGWKGPLEIILSAPPAQASSATASCPGKCPVGW